MYPLMPVKYDFNEAVSSFLNEGLLFQKRKQGDIFKKKEKEREEGVQFRPN